MTEQDITRLLNELSQSTDALHEEAESIDELIDSVEDRLRGMKMVMETWLEEHPLSSRDVSVSASSVAPRVDIQLGFAPMRHGGKDEWCLQLREAEYISKANLDGGMELARILQRRRLRDCTRDERVAILSILPLLIERMIAATRQRTETIRSSKKLLE